MDRITSYLLTLILKTLGRNSTACFYQDAPSKNMLSVGKHILRGSPKVISRYLISPTPLFHLTVSSKNVILCNRSWSGMAVAVAWRWRWRCSSDGGKGSQWLIKSGTCDSIYKWSMVFSELTTINLHNLLIFPLF